VRPTQSTSLPVCSTVLLVYPSIPTQKAAYWSPLEHVPAGWVQLAETLV
jgi:hypothetical protein